MKESLTEYQRVNLLNQYKILRELALIRDDQHMADEYEQLANIVAEGYVIEYDRLTTELSEEMTVDESRFVLNVLDMYSVIYISYQKIKNPKLTMEDIRFDGFDGNEEIYHYSFCKYILLDEHRFPELSAGNRQDFNSHYNRIDIYQEMLNKWEAMGKPRTLNENEIEKLIA